MPEIEIKYKWQQEMVEDIGEMDFTELIDHMVLIASIGDQMDHRDIWQLEYLIKFIKEKYGCKCGALEHGLGHCICGGEYGT